MEKMDDLNLVHRDNSNLISARKRALRRQANVDNKSAFLNADIIGNNSNLNNQKIRITDSECLIHYLKGI